MQVTGENVQQNQIRPQYNCCVSPNVAQTQTQPATQQVQTAPVQNNVQPQVQTNSQTRVPVQPQYYPQYCAPQYAQYPQAQPTNNYQIPASASGVNIQIFNPSVGTPGSQPPTYNVNAPCYPANYYTNQMGQNGGLNGQGTLNGQGAAYGTNQGNNGTGVNNDSSNTTNTTNSETDSKKKTEKRKIVQLTDQYIMNLENYLNSKEKEVRLSAAKEVFNRLEEDESRKDDKALTALINKMLQDPAQEIRLLALTALEGRIVVGDEYTRGLLERMQQSKDGYGQDAVDASKILLQMSGKQVEKDLPVKETSKTSTKTEEKKETTESNKV